MLSVDPYLTPADVKRILRDTADDIDAAGIDDKTGAGIVNAYEAAAYLLKKPRATTNSATSVSSFSATLNGTVNPNGSPTDYYFEYGLTPSYGSTTSASSAGSDTTDVPVSEVITISDPLATHHFRLVAANSFGTAYGQDMTFTNDTGADSMPDDRERNHFGNLSRDGTQDFDGDALSDLAEYQNGTNPTDTDSDDDDLPDWWEVTYGLDPLDDTGDNGRNGDFDNDGWTNYEEYSLGKNPADNNSPAATPPVLVEANPYDDAGIGDNTRIPNHSSFAVRIADLDDNNLADDGIDVTDLSSIKFTINDGVHPAYERHLSDTDTVRVIKLTSDDDTAGKAIMDLYYSFSPPAANFIAKNDLARMAARWSLVPLVAMSWMALKRGLTLTAILILLSLSILGTGAVITLKRGRFNQQK